MISQSRYSFMNPLGYFLRKPRSATIVGMVSYVVAGCTMGYGCKGVGNDCYGFKDSIVTFSLVDAYTEDTPYQSETDPWPRGSLRADRASESCGRDDILPNPVRVELQGRWQDYSTCDRHFGTLMDRPDLDFPIDGDREISGLTTWLNEAVGGADLLSAGRGELFEGCHGWYSIILYSGPQYYAGATVPKDQIFDPPTPGQLPNWFVLRLFEPDEECEGLYLGDDPDITWCADTWVAQIDSIEPR